MDKLRRLVQVFFLDADGNVSKAKITALLIGVVNSLGVFDMDPAFIQDNIEFITIALTALFGVFLRDGMNS